VTRIGPLAFWVEKGIGGMPNWKHLTLYVVLQVWKFSFSTEYHLGRTRE
jgi:hypothetical protein